MIPDRRLMTDGLKRFEEEIEKDGWDQEPLLGTLHQYRDNEIEALAALPFVLQPHNFDPEPDNGLMYLGGILRTGGPPPILSPAKGRSFVGVFFASECRRNDIAPEERDGRRLADIPGSREARFLYAIDTAGRSFVVFRERGRGSTVEIVEKGVNDRGVEADVGGRVVIGLRDMVWAIGRQLPLGSVDLDAVGAIGAEDLEDGA